MTISNVIFSERRTFTERRLKQFVSICVSKLDDSHDWVIGDHGCVYAVGSAGRMESTDNSDLDIFLVDKRVSHGSAEQSIHGTILRSAVTRSFRVMGLPDPSNGGEFLQLHALNELTKQIGERTDDPQNTFTARMLLLLESRPLIGQDTYDEVVDQVIQAYWKDYHGHETDYIPIVLINDIVRYWRMLLLNYVAMNMRQTLRDEPDFFRKRRLRSYKLRFARCLTCYSALAYILALKNPGIKLEHIKAMVVRCPYDRLDAVREMTEDPTAKSLIDRLLACYADFLQLIAMEKEKLLCEFDTHRKDQHYREGDEFGRTMAKLMLRLGEQAPELFRFMIV